MRQKSQLKQFEEFDAWSFSRSGGRISSDDVHFEFPRFVADESILLGKIGFWGISGHINSKSESVLHLYGHFAVELPCTVCGLAVLHNIDFGRHLVLTTSEALADAYDIEVLDEYTDVVACPGSINLRDWLEDEILLACPMFPKHEACLAKSGRSWHENIDINDVANIENHQDDAAGGLIKEVQRPFANLGDLLKSKKQ